MSELTREFFEQTIKDQTKELKAYTHEQTEELARMVKTGFDGVDRQLAALDEKLDVRSTVLTLQRRLEKIEERMGIK